MIRRSRPLPAVLAVIALSVVASNCGSSPSAISANAAAELSQQVGAIRTAAASNDRSIAQAQLERLRSDVAALQAQHQLTSNRAAQILAAASAVESELASGPNTTTTTTVATTTTIAGETPSIPAPNTGPPGKRKHGKG